MFCSLLGLSYFAGGVGAVKFANDGFGGLPSDKLETVMRSVVAAAVCLVSQLKKP